MMYLFQELIKRKRMTNNIKVYSISFNYLLNKYDRDNSFDILIKYLDNSLKNIEDDLDLQIKFENIIDICIYTILSNDHSKIYLFIDHLNKNKLIRDIDNKFMGNFANQIQNIIHDQNYDNILKETLNNYYYENSDENLSELFNSFDLISNIYTDIHIDKFINYLAYCNTYSKKLERDKFDNLFEIITNYNLDDFYSNLIIELIYFLTEFFSNNNQHKILLMIFNHYSLTYSKYISGERYLEYIEQFETKF